MEFDAIVSESPEHDATITEYPVELGANLADHVIVQPMRVTLLGVVSNHPSRSITANMDGVLETGEGVFVPISRPLLPGASRLGLPTNVGPLPLTYETTVRANVRTFSGQVTRVSACYNELLNLQRSATAITIVSDLGEWDSMQLESLRLRRDASTSQAPRFEMAFKQIANAFLEQRDSNGILIEPKPVTQRSRPKRNEGKKQPEVMKESMLKQVTDYFSK
jgi:hypothetical protein